MVTFLRLYNTFVCGSFQNGDLGLGIGDLPGHDLPNQFFQGNQFHIVHVSTDIFEAYGLIRLAEKEIINGIDYLEINCYTPTKKANTLSCLLFFFCINRL